MNEKIQEDIKFLKRGKYRMDAFKLVTISPIIPSKIASGLDILTSRISAILRSLTSHDLVYCVNPEVSKCRVYDY